MTDQVAAIIVAAGRGLRAGGEVPKQWRLLAGRPVLAHTLEAFRAAGISRIMLVLHPDEMDRAVNLCAVTAVAGGASRTASVRAALEVLDAAPPDHVLIHDGARPFVSARMINDVLAALATAPGAAPAVALSDALWRGTYGGVDGVLPRDGLYRAQTPQGFHFKAILAAHRAYEGEAADDVAIARAAGLSVCITPGSEDNFKLTYPEDFKRATQLMAGRAQKEPAMDIRFGTGYDVHRFGPGSGCWLCGILVPYDRALQGHSDADVGLHALTDAILGALAMGDIGRHFPPSDPQWKGAASDIFLTHATDLACAHGYTISNCDVTLICEHPKIGPHASAMRDRVAEIMQISRDRVSVKATTTEQLGFTGRGEGIAAMASACLTRP